jgi:hypothetical protein
MVLNNDAGTYTLDLTGEQFGYINGPALPYDIYEKRIDRGSERGWEANKLGTALRVKERFVKSCRSPGELICHLVDVRASACIAPTIRTWLDEKNICVSRMLDLPQRLFEESVRDIVDTVANRIDQSLNVMDDSWLNSAMTEWHQRRG